MSEYKIMIVDDEKDIVDLLEEILQKEGFHSVQKAYTEPEQSQEATSLKHLQKISKIRLFS